MIYDPNTQRVVAESARIARYLDATYPDAGPRLLSREADALYAAFEAAFRTQVFPHRQALAVPLACLQLSPRSAEYFRCTREEMAGARLEDLAPPGSEKRKGHWAGLEKAFTVVAQWLDAGEDGRPFFMGEQISYADITVASFLIWFRILFGEESEEWKTMMRWNGGRWAKFMEAFKPYEAVDVGTENQP